MHRSGRHEGPTWTRRVAIGCLWCRIMMLQTACQSEKVVPDPCMDAWPNQLRPNLLLDRLKVHPMTNTEIPTPALDGLPTLDWRWEQDRKKAHELHQLELPFVLQHVPDVEAGVERWKSNEYLVERMKHQKHSVTVAHTGRFMYFSEDKAKKSKSYHRPTQKMELTMEEFFQLPLPDLAEDTHYYFLAGKADHNWIAEEMPTFQNLNEETKAALGWGQQPLPAFLAGPASAKSFRQVIRDETDSGRLGHGYLGTDANGIPLNAGLLLNSVNNSRATHDETGFSAGDRYINMRIGQKGVIAEGHFDVSRNFIVMMRGARRYFLMHPCECLNAYIELADKEDPEYRHWKVRPDLPDFDMDSAPLLQNVRALDVTVQAGDILYVPSYWIHYLVSLTDHNIQLNIRSGIAVEGFDHVQRASGSVGVQRRMQLERQYYLTKQRIIWEKATLLFLSFSATVEIFRRKKHVLGMFLRPLKGDKGLL